MLKLKLPANRIQYLTDEVRARFDPDILERGWQYYHKGRVQSLELKGGVELRASVRETQTYAVTLDLDAFSRSSCECPYDGCCKHMAAVFFQVYESHGRPELLLRQLQHAIRTRSRGNKSTAAAVKAKKEAERPIGVTPEEGPDGWHRFFEQRFFGYSLHQPQAVEEFYNMALPSLQKLAEQWNPRLIQLYTLHVLLYVLRKVEHLYEESQSTYMSYYVGVGCTTVSERCREALEELLRTSDAGSIRKAFPKQWEETIAYVGETMLTGKPGPIEWLDLYRLLWWRWFYDGEGEGSNAREERLRLKLRLDQEELTSRREDTLLLALAHLDMMAGKEEQAFRLLDGLHTRKIGDFRVVLRHLADTEQWEKLIEWLRWLLPETAKARQDEFVMICGFWQKAAGHADSDQEWVRVMVSLLPRSYPFYAGYLMQTGRIKMWVDLQLSLNVMPNQLHTMDLKTVETEDIGLLLPLYHQAVERSILEKNRASYTTAVRLLRKLHGVYKKLKRLDRWEAYLLRLSAKYARLRAFQEELKKGKWLT